MLLLHDVVAVASMLVLENESGSCHVEASVKLKAAHLTCHVEGAVPR